jgi:hypothetical protein
MAKISISKPRRRRKYKTPEEAREARREYQRKYYLAHKEKAKEYQRLYNLTHKKKQRAGVKDTNGIEFIRERYKRTINTHDLMHSPVEKTLKMLEGIIKGERFFTM